MEIKVLIVEDSEKLIQLYKDQIENYNKENISEVKILPDFQRNLEEGLNALVTNFYDAAIVDIKLSSDDTKGKGNQILKKIKDHLRFPVFIITGFPWDIEKELREENIFWKIYKRDEVEVGKVLDEIVRIVKTGIINILGSKGYIEEYLRKIFWEHIAENFEEIMRFSPESSAEQVLIRYVSAHLMEYLDVRSSPDIPYIPAEFYIKPSVRSEHFTGDILKEKSNSDLFVILNPPCDMVIRAKGTRKAEKFLCAKIKKWNEVDRRFQTITPPISNSQRGDLKTYLKNKNERYHFVPPYKDIPAGFIDFQILKSLSEDEIRDKYDRVATISPLFMRDIIARFSRYYARQGQPDLDIEKILMKMLPDENSG